ncbi:MAG: diguanylate cyclase [Rhodobacteraceae bacterium]|nr:diguanylate cyclase [Paracoccaceae bacterium]
MSVHSLSDAKTAAEEDGLRIGSSALDILLPLHVLLRPPGIIVRAGPTFAKLSAGTELPGRDIFEILAFRRPNEISRWEDLYTVERLPLIAELATLSGHNLKAVAVVVSGGEYLLLNFSLGAGVHEIVGKRELKTQDFSPADPTGEMLYMVEMQSVLLAQSRDLNNRLNGAKIMAEEQAYTDSLTGLNNRRAMRSYIARTLDRKVSAAFAVLLIDLDHFKPVNDTFGHAAGDHVLQEVSRVLLSETRSTDMVSRVGGDEFIVVLSDFGTLLNLQEVAYRIIKKLSKPIKYGSEQCSVGASIGAAIATTDAAETVDTILDKADAALYSAKGKGRGTFALAESGCPTGQEQVPEDAIGPKAVKF